LKKRVYLFQHFADLAQNDQPLKIPTPMFNIMNGGAHAGMALDFQEFMIIPNAAAIPAFPNQLEVCSTITHELKTVLKQHILPSAVGDEGGYAPKLKQNKQAIDLIKDTVSILHYRFGQDVLLGIDCAANTYFKNGHYQIRDEEHPLNTEGYSRFLTDLVDRYRLFSLEDAFPEDNWSDWQSFTHHLGSRTLIVGDDLIVTNPQRLDRAIKAQACTGVIIKPNQIGTVTEAIEVLVNAQSHALKTVVSHRSGETTDTLIADFAVGTGADLVKFGAPVRGERVAKYNRLLAIGTLLNSDES